MKKGEQRKDGVQRARKRKGSSTSNTQIRRQDTTGQGSRAGAGGAAVALCSRLACRAFAEGPAPARQPLLCGHKGGRRLLSCPSWGTGSGGYTRPLGYRILCCLEQPPRQLGE